MVVVVKATGNIDRRAGRGGAPTHVNSAGTRA